jgi:uncharacterized Zn finger protein
MAADALITKIDAGRKARAESLRVQITFMDLDTGIVRGKVLSSNGETTYNVRINTKKRTCRCQCKDFERRLQPCKHLAATAMVLKRIAQGQTVSEKPKTQARKRWVN